MADCAKPPDGQCGFFLSRKNRFCRFRPNKGQKYCAEHAFALGVELERKRVVCPLNPKHTCYEDCLDKHLKKCNSRKRKLEDYFQEGINTGSDEGVSVTESQTAVKATDPDRLKQMIYKVNKLYEEHIGRLDRDIRAHECLKEELENPTYGQPALRHHRQNASLIGQLDHLSLLTPGHCYVEMGAGKGQLSHWVRKAISSHDDAGFLLVDRSSIRYKVDGYHKEEKVQFERIKIDIEHLNLGKVPMVSKSRRPLVAMGKHLCGAATDLTLRCLMETLQSSQDTLQGPAPKRHRGENMGSMLSEQCEVTGISGGETPQTLPAKSPIPEPTGKASVESMDKSRNACCTKSESAEEGAGPSSVSCKVSEDPRKPAGILIALCCHHQCTWQAYVGKSFMQQCGFTASDFSLLTRLSSWAVCGWLGQDGSFDSAENKSKQSGQSRESGTLPESDSLQTSQTNNFDEDQDEHVAHDLITETDKKCTLQLSEKEKKEVGWRCKRLLDYGRACYLRNHGMHSVLKEYIDPSQTPENVVLVAVPSTSSQTDTCS
ncbi:hypothetical protein BaRGS_00007649 [Batillaria attramentaria]|uniref:tRNA:m(4)X modification enzyme TRM13 n=1 Tax=Batillaria attramentaria TaxID=370345 RepID=A0ABD0LNW8_9CAEN